MAGNIGKRTDEPIGMKKVLLEELLMQSTRAELINTAEILAIKIKKSQTKGLIAREMARTILDVPYVLLSQLPLQELLKLRGMVYAKDHAVPFTTSFIVSPTVQIGLSDISFDGQQYKEYITPDLAKAIEPLLETVEKHFDVKRYHHEQLIIGLLNLYGLLDMQELQELAAFHEPQLNSSALELAIMCSYVLKSCEMVAAGKLLYCSPYLDQPEHLLKEISQRKTIKKARFTLNEILDAGVWGSALPPVNQQTSSLRHELGRLKKTDEEITALLTDLWMLLNNDLDPLAMLMEIIEENPTTLEEVNRLMAVFIQWSNALPRWILKANSSHYVFETYERPALQKRPPTLVMRPDSAAANISQEEVNRMWEGAQSDSIPKVGRNEACPCKSGKKFKHCCLKKQ